MSKIIEKTKEKLKNTYESALEGIEEATFLMANDEALSQHRELLGRIFDSELNNPNCEERTLSEISNQIKNLDWISKLRESEAGLKVVEELRVISKVLPNSIENDNAGRLGLAAKNYAVEMVVSNIVELGIFDGGSLTLILASDLPTSTKVALGLIILYSAQPLPLPSIAGVTRTAIHRFYSRPQIQKYNRDQGINDNRKLSMREIDWITTLEYTGLIVPILPLVNLFDAYGIDISSKTLTYLYTLKKLMSFEKTYLEQHLS